MPRPRASKKVKKSENPMLPLWKIQPRPTARSKKKFTAPKAEILQKSAKTAQKAAPAKKAENSMLPLSKI